MIDIDFSITFSVNINDICAENLYTSTTDINTNLWLLRTVAQKYLWRGILFKMADGSVGPFNGSDEAASKAAGHDLKGSVHYSNCGVRELHVPLIALIDYKGFRMSAQAFLPLGPESMVYGSAGGWFMLLQFPSFLVHMCTYDCTVTLNTKIRNIFKRSEYQTKN